MNGFSWGELSVGTPSLKLTATYRVDAFRSAPLTLDAAGNNVEADRIYHGAHLTLTGDF